MIRQDSKYFILDSKTYSAGHFTMLYPEPAKPVYEVIRIIDRKPVFLEEHLRRLHNSAIAIGAKSINKTKVRHETEKTISLNPISDGNIRIEVFSAQNAWRILYYFVPHRYPTADEYAKGVALKTLNASREHPAIKQINAELLKKAGAILQDCNIYEAVLVKDGFVTEGSKSNIFFVQSNTLATAPKEDVLEGITRMKILDIARNNGIASIEKKINIETLPDFEACFITGTSPKILPVNRMDKISFNPENPLVRKMMGLYNQAIREELTK